MQTKIKADTNLSSPGEDDICEAVGRSFDRSFSRLGANKKSVTATFQASLEGLRNAKQPEQRLRSIAKSAALSTGRCHGNVMDTARCILDLLETLAPKHGLKIDLARDQILLGIAEGACQLGPVVYCRFLDVASTYREDAEEWIARNRRLPVAIELTNLPVIVPYEASLTLHQQGSPAVVPPENSAPGTTEQDLKQEWSRPKQRNIFRRLTEAVGHFFGG